MKLFAQELDNSVWNFSPFQINTANEIEAREDFASFVNINFKENETEGYVRKQGPFVVLWYDKVGHLNGWRCGVRKVLFKVKSTEKNSAVKSLEKV